MNQMLTIAKEWDHARLTAKLRHTQRELITADPTNMVDAARQASLLGEPNEAKEILKKAVAKSMSRYVSRSEVGRSSLRS